MNLIFYFALFVSAALV